jgi:hypothetical protein
MKTYRVMVAKSYTQFAETSVEVEAEDEEQAQEEAEAMVSDRMWEYDWTDTDAGDDENVEGSYVLNCTDDVEEDEEEESEEDE